MKTKNILLGGFVFTFIILISLVGCDKEETDDIEVPKTFFVELSMQGKEYKFSKELTVNFYRYGNEEDQLSVVVYDSIDQHCEIHILKANLLEREYPITINSEPYESGEIQIIDSLLVNHLFGPNDSINYSGTTLIDLEMKILSFNDNVIEGEIKGPIRTTTGKELNIINGYFRVPIELILIE